MKRKELLQKLAELINPDVFCGVPKTPGCLVEFGKKEALGGAARVLKGLPKLGIKVR